MSRFSKSIFALALAGAATTGFAFDQYQGLGRAATPAEVKAWDIDVRPDFKGLPKGSGNVDRGMEVFEEKCASCHGTFGESNEVFTPLVGGTTKDDMKTGHVRGFLQVSCRREQLSQKSPLFPQFLTTSSARCPGQHLSR